MKQIEVTIMGQSYLLACPEDGELMLTQAVAQVDREMTAIRDSGRVRSRERIAVLAALNLAYALAERPALPADAQVVDGQALQAAIDRIDQAVGEDGRLI